MAENINKINLIKVSIIKFVPRFSLQSSHISLRVLMKLFLLFYFKISEIKNDYKKSNLQYPKTNLEILNTLYISRDIYGTSY